MSSKRRLNKIRPATPTPVKPRTSRYGGVSDETLYPEHWDTGSTDTSSTDTGSSSSSE